MKEQVFNELIYQLIKIKAYEIFLLKLEKDDQTFFDEVKLQIEKKTAIDKTLETLKNKLNALEERINRFEKPLVALPKIQQEVERLKIQKASLQNEILYQKNKLAQENEAFDKLKKNPIFQHYSKIEQAYNNEKKLIIDKLEKNFAQIHPKFAPKSVTSTCQLTLKRALEIQKFTQILNDLFGTKFDTNQDIPKAIKNFVEKIEVQQHVELAKPNKLKTQRNATCQAFNQKSCSAIKEKLYRASLMQYVADELKHNNLFASKLYNLIERRAMNIQQYLNNPFKPGHSTFEQYLQNYTPSDFNLSRTVITQVLDELIKPPKNLQNDDLVATAKNFKSGIIEYINKTYTSMNFLRRGRAASDRRLADMHRILVAINQAENVGDLIEKVKNELGEKKIKRGFFGRSQLVDIMKEHVDKYEANLKPKNSQLQKASQHGARA